MAAKLLVGVPMSAAFRTLAPFLPLMALLPLTGRLVDRVTQSGPLAVAAVVLASGIFVTEQRRSSATDAQRRRWPAWCVAAFALVALALGLLLWATVPVLAGGVGLAVALQLWRSEPDRQRIVALSLGSFLIAALNPADVEALLGWPMRLLQARNAADLLALVSGKVTAVESVLQYEGQAAALEEVCSGTRSLTALALLLIGAAAVLALRRPPPAFWRMTIAALAATITLISLSTLRVALLVLAQVHAPSVGAEVHEPLGILAVQGAAVVGLLTLDPGLFRPIAPRPASHQPTVSPAQPGSREHSFGQTVTALAAAVVVACVAAALCWGSPEALPAQTPPSAWRLEQLAEYRGELRLTAAEDHLFRSAGAGARKVALVDGASLLLVAGDRSVQHPPERCLAANGFEIFGAETRLTPAGEVRVLAVRDGEWRGYSTSLYRSPIRVTASALERSVREVLGQEGPWTLVSWLGNQPPEDAAISRLLSILQQPQGAP